MMNLLAAIGTNCLIAISNGHLDWPLNIVLEHEKGHCICPEWKHGENASNVNDVRPPLQCRGQYKGNEIIVPMTPSEAHKACHNHDACVVDIW